MPASGSPGRSAGSWTSGAAGSSAAAIVRTAGSSSYSTWTRRGRLLGGVLRLGRDGRDRLAVVLRLADGEDRPVAELRPEARHGLGQVGGGHDEAHARDLLGGASCRSRRSGPARSRAVTSFAWSTSGRRMSATYCWRPVTRSTPPTRGAARRRSRCRGHRSRLLGGRQDRLGDLLVAGAAAEVAGQPLVDVSARRMRVPTRAGRGPPSSWPGMQKPHWTAPWSRKASWSAAQAAVDGQPLDGRAPRAPSASTASTRQEFDGPAVDDDGAGAALADEAALLGAGQAEVVAQDVEQGVVDGDLQRAAGAR